MDNYIYHGRDRGRARKHDDHDDHGGLILANYLQNDAELSGYEIEIGKVFELNKGNLSLSLPEIRSMLSSRMVVTSHEWFLTETSTEFL